MAFKIKDGLRIGTIDVFNNTADTLKIKDPGSANIATVTPTTLSGNRTYYLPNIDGGTLITTADTGTVSGTMIASAAVTYAKIQNISAQYRVLGRISSGAGIAEELTGDNLITIANQAASTYLGMTHGGTGATLTASNGGIVYSGGSTLAILSGTATANQILMSGSSTTPAWSSATYPSSTTANQILYSSSTNVIGQITAANTSALVTNNSGVPSLTSGTTANRVLRTDGTTISFAQVAISTDVSGLGANVATFLATPTSANLAAAITDEIGTSGKLVFDTSPTFQTSVDGTATFGAWASSTTLTLGYTGTATSSVGISTGAVGSGNTKTLNIGTGGAAGSTTNVNLGSTTGSSLTTVNGDLTISGNFIVNGTTSTMNVSTITVDDKNIELGSVGSATISTTGTVGTITGSGPWNAVITGMTSTTGLIVGSPITATAGTGTLYGGSPTSCVVTAINSATSINYTVTGSTTPSAGPVTNVATTGATDTTANGGGITLKGASDKAFNWVSGTSAWTSSENLDLASGKAYEIAGTSVLSATTLGSGVVNSSLTSVGTLTGLTITGTGTNAISLTTGTTGALPLATGTTGAINIGTNGNAKTITIGNNTGATAVDIITGSGNLDITTPLATISGDLTVTGGDIKTGAGVASTLFGDTTTGNITVAGALTSGTFTIGQTGSTGAVSLFPATGSQAITLGGATTGIITIGSTGAASVQLPTGKTKIGQTFLAQGDTNTYTLPSAGGNDTLVSVTSTATLTNKTLTDPTTDNIKASGTSTAADLWSEITTGSIAIAAGFTTGTLNLDASSTDTHSVNIASGASASGKTKTLNIGTGGLSGSTTTITIGSTLGTTSTLNGTVVIPTLYGSTSSSGNLGISATSNATKGTITVGDANNGTVTVQGANLNMILGSSPSAGFLKVAATTGAISIDTNTYLTSSSNTLQIVTTAGNTSTNNIQMNGAALVLAPSTTAKFWTQAFAPTNISVNTAVAIDTFATATYRSAKYLIQLTQGTKYQFHEVHLIHDGTTVYPTEYAVLESNSASPIPVTLSYSIATGTLTVNATVTDAASTNVAILIERTLIAV